MTSEKFGEVELIRDEWPRGIILQEDETGVVLVENLDNNGIILDILHRFPAECRLKNQEDLANCLIEARKHETDLKKPIYIKVVYKPTEPRSEDEEAKRRAQIEKIVERSGTHPWNFRVFNQN